VGSTVRLYRHLDDRAEISLQSTAEASTLRTFFETDPTELLAAAAEATKTLEPRPGTETEAMLAATLASARTAFLETAAPRGVFKEIDADEFEAVYRGRGDNDEPSPVQEVAAGSQFLALFAVTLGEAVSSRIRDLFAARELAEGYLLDQIASFTADALAQASARRFEAAVGAPGLAVLPYSPGYCGWAVSGQHALFGRLRPDEIGITVNDSALMQPVKSVSGVLIAAPVAVHTFEPRFACCAACTTMECSERIASLLSE
jgi:hypothetical protein